jgi:Na+-driven multidrug efflux pump
MYIAYLKIRALGTPAATLWLVTNGIFRGLGQFVYDFIFMTLIMV